MGKPSALSARFGVVFNVIDVMGEGLLHKEEIDFPTQKPDLWGLPCTNPKPNLLRQVQHWEA